jgi:Anti-sigma regulatory factor (Ser/Thr protein kinase)
MNRSRNRRLKHLRKYLPGLGLVLLAAALLLWFLPARWAMPWLAPRLHGLRLQQVQGLLWDGRADQVVAADGRVLGRLQWQLSRRALLGTLRLQLDFDGPQLAFSGGMQRLPEGRIALHEVNVRAELAALDHYISDHGGLNHYGTSPLGQPRGELRLTVDHALLQGGWPLQLQAQAQWRHAVVHTHGGDVALGDLQWQAQAQDGVIQAQVHDDGNGPLHADGQMRLSPLGFRLDAVLRPRQTDPALRRWLAGLGQPAADGSVHIRRSSGLAGSLPAPSTH